MLLPLSLFILAFLFATLYASAAAAAAAAFALIRFSIHAIAIDAHPKFSPAADAICRLAMATYAAAAAVDATTP